MSDNFIGTWMLDDLSLCDRILTTHNEQNAHSYTKELKRILAKYASFYNIVYEGSKKEVFNFYLKDPSQSIWVCEKDPERNLVWITFLNDDIDGGIEFYYQGITIPVEKGLTVVWPAHWTYTYKHNVGKNNKNYIIQGYF